MKQLRNKIYAYHKTYFPLIIIYLLFTLAIGFIGFEFFNDQYTQKLKLLGNITGAVLSENPSLENTLLDAIQTTNDHHIAKGFAILNRYGYRESMSMYEDEPYRDSLESFLCLILLFFILSFSLLHYTLYCLIRTANYRNKNF